MTDQSLKVTVKVSESRWREAQDWERDGWIATEKKRARFFKNWIWPVFSVLGLKPRYRGNDWNDWWADHFGHYHFLPDHVGNAIELGCGPYTNWRLIGERCHAEHLVLSDPLIRTYVGFPHTFLRHLYRKAACMVDDHPIEDCPFSSGRFDLVVMINVLDHVRDAEVCLQTALRLVRPGGWLIVGQDLTDAGDLERLRDAPGHEGHPITVDEAWMRTQLGDALEPVVDCVLPREKGRCPEHHSGTFLIAGQRRAVRPLY
jgi:SAM-dependent methyltransferase